MVRTHRLKHSVLGNMVWVALVTAPTGASAASDNPIQGILGGIINSVQQQATREKWKQLPDEMLQCMDLGLRSSGSSVSASITKAVGPDSREFDATRNICDQLLNRPLRQDFPCVLTDKKTKKNFDTRCNEIFVAKGATPQKPLGKLEAAAIVFSGGNVMRRKVMTPAAWKDFKAERREAQARATKEQEAVQARIKAAEAERAAAQAKREAEDAERKRLAEEARQKRLSEEAERRRQAEDKERTRVKTLADETARLLAEREKCKPALSEIGFIGAKLKTSETLKQLGDPKVPSKISYTTAIPFLLAGAGKYVEVEQVAGARVVEDVQFWSAAIGAGDYTAISTWADASAVLRQNCLFELSDYLGVSIALSQPSYLDFATRKIDVLPGTGSIAADTLKQIPPQFFEVTAKMGRVTALPGIVKAALERRAQQQAAEERKRQLAREAEEQRLSSVFNEEICLNYINRQNVLERGADLTEPQRREYGKICACTYNKLKQSGQISVADGKFEFVPLHMIVSLGSCALEYGMKF
jgi:hypothetical protein